MLIIEKHGLLFFRFSNLSRLSKLRHGIFTRRGGVSSKPFDSLNISFGVGDSPDRVRQNRHILSESFDPDKNDATMVYLKQVHSDHVCIIDSDFMPEKANDSGTYLKGDAVVTNMPGRNLVIQVADCQPVLIYDPMRHVGANVHSGWRGSIHNIIGKTIEAMENYFGSNPKDIVAGIGPSLGPCCAEFINYRTEIPRQFWNYKIKNNHFDFWRLSQDQMISQGVLVENIETAGMCTRCRTDLFFSYRGEKVTGRFSAVLRLDKR